MDTLTKSRSPTIVITANGEVQTHEEATVHVKELDIFLTMKVLDNTPAVLSIGKLCDENGYSYEWINGQKPHLKKKRDSDNLQYGELRSYRRSRLVKFFLCIFINLTDTYETGESLLNIFFQLVFFTCSRWNSGSRKGRCTLQWHLSTSASVWIRLMIERRNLWKSQPTKHPNPMKKRPR